MTSKKNTLTLDLKERHNDCTALIHATGDHLAGTHWAVAEVVVRMDGDKEDTPELVNFAHELVAGKARKLINEPEGGAA